MNLRRLKSLLLSPLPWLRLFYHFFYQFYHLFINSIICKFLRMTWYIVDRQVNKFRTSSIHVDLAVACCHCLSLCLWLCLGCPLLCLCLLCAWVCSSVCVCVCCVYACTWFVGSSVCICCWPCCCLLSLPVLMSLAVPESSALLSISAVCLGPFLRLRLRLLYLCLYLVCRFFHLCLLSVPVPGSFAYIF